MSAKAREGVIVVIVVAALLLPALGLVLYGMDRIEDWLTNTSQTPRHARARRHLRLIPGGARFAARDPRRKRTDAA
ncbi:hypothetical protein RKE29_09360 [Streptomyces sp. B1866]|uniref:hypothetical protein n=1 Tax=Streptomyces sp. B1866 TaxID=3075431 RepID=UPI00288FBC17|nr:hypothetical protein [Streptomyces sp. B1866]MDT3396848.1 hypothetical protein [Streptomyces sp. B1866]